MVQGRGKKSGRSGGLGGGGGEGGRGGGSNNRRPSLKSSDPDSKCGRSHSFSVRDVEWEGQERRWSAVWGSPPEEGQRGLKDSPIFSR